MPHAEASRQAPATALDPHLAHPLAASVRAVDRAVSLLSFQTLADADLSAGGGAPWIRCDHALSAPAFFQRWRAMAAQLLVRRPGCIPEQSAPHSAVPPKTTGGYVLQWYLIIPSYFGGLLFHTARRVPELAPSRLAFRLDHAVLRDVGLRPGRFWCLPDDPDAEHPDAMPVPDEAALGATLRRQVTAHATEFLAVYSPQLRVGNRTQWATVTDVLDSAMLLAGRSFGSPQAGAADAQLVLGAGEKPLTSGSTICQVTDDRGRTHWTRLRGSCCFLYALPGVTDPCASCPRNGEDERAHIFGTIDPA
ncbi:MAG: (2Fe-2S)-binding protein [Pseudonocardiaceae bacterium]